jgi:AcrR family transcriptional regulator
MKLAPKKAAPASGDPAPDNVNAPIVRRLRPAHCETPNPPLDRRMKILLNAEKLFALRGYHAVALRDIAAHAGVPVALISYYFGAKHELYRAIFASWQADSPKERHACLHAALSAPDAPDLLERILDAFISPVVELRNHPDGKYYALMAARDLAAPPPEADAVVREFFDPLAHAFIDALMLTAPGATRGQVARCYQFALGSMLHYLSDKRIERLSHQQRQAHDPADKGELLRFIAAGFRAVVGAKARPKPMLVRRQPS